MSQIVLVGEAVKGSRTHQRERALREAGHDVLFLPTTPAGRQYEDPPSTAARIRWRLRYPADETRVNASLAALRHEPLAILFDNARAVRAATLRTLRRRFSETRFIWYAEDDMANPAHLSRQTAAALPLFSLCVTTKSHNAELEELPALGARRVLFVNNGFDPAIHHTVAVSDKERLVFGSPVTFVGTYENERATSIMRLASAGVGVRVWGNGWGSLKGRIAGLRIEGCGVYDEDYARVIAASEINLCFLRRFNRDRQTTRSVEIPACGGFMLHERNPEILGLFAEDREAGYFSGDDELAMQCRRWLNDPVGRAAVAAAAQRRAVALGLSHRNILDRVLQVALGGEP